MIGNKALSNSTTAGNFNFLFSEGIDNATQQKKVYLIFLHLEIILTLDAY